MRPANPFGFAAAAALTSAWVMVQNLAWLHPERWKSQHRPWSSLPRSERGSETHCCCSLPLKNFGRSATTTTTTTRAIPMPHLSKGSGRKEEKVDKKEPGLVEIKQGGGSLWEKMLHVATVSEPALACHERERRGNETYLQRVVVVYGCGVFFLPRRNHQIWACGAVTGAHV